MTTNHIIHHEGREYDTPKLWIDMTDAEKGALLVAHHEGEVIECYQWPSYGWAKIHDPQWDEDSAYRAKPAPKITEHVLWWDDCSKSSYPFRAFRTDRDTHKITIRYPGDALPFGTYPGPDGAEFVVGKAK